MVFTFMYSHDNLQRLVKEETSLLAERRDEITKDGQTIDRFGLLVMDEEYETMFRRLFSEASAELMTVIPVRLVQHTPTDLLPVFNEFPDFSKDRDFVLFLAMPHNFAPQYKHSIDALIQRFLIDYICWRWFETKSPVDAETYFNRLEKTKRDILDLLNKEFGVMMRMPSFP